MTVKKGDHVFVNYTGTLENGTKFDSSEGREPLEFDVGAGQMIKGFDAAVVGMKTGEEKTVKIKAADAYGEADPRNVIDVPKSNVPPGVKAGDTLYSQGQPVKVVGVTNNTVKLDANHPLAGKDLTFKIKLVKIGK
ncbi:MAG: FKBP-type peptidyl-prolyl cis-trans isomerase [Candidatus Aenigmarchaeota archaeon]|nr:FKBP-type peptidyl-prolyl cis-trans isomerase [Candidatus Aenigmarchaeota archaeon]